MAATLPTLRRTDPQRLTTLDGRYEVLVRIADDGYRTFRFRVAGERAYGEVCYLREARKAIADHIASGGLSWNLP